MRLLKFRGFDKIADSWIIGGICFDADIKGRAYITCNFNEMIEVELETIGQFTGLFDKNGTEIYEGDQIGHWCEEDGMRMQSCLQVFWNEFTASYHVDNSYSQDKSYSEELWQALENGDYEVVGNIHQKN